MILFDDKDKIQTLEVKCEMLEQESTRLCKEIVALKDEIASLRKLVRWRNDNTRATVLSIPDDVVGAFLRALEEKP